MAREHYGEGANKQELTFMLHLYDEYQRLMFFVAGKCSSDPFEREEIVQDTVVKLLCKVKLLQTLDEKALAAYVSTAARNTAYSRMRKRGREQSLFIPWTDDLTCIPSHEGSAEERLIALEEKADLVEVWADLSEEERFLLEGRYFLRQTDHEMAETLDCQPGTVRMKLTRLRRKVFARMKERDGEGGEPS